MTPRAEGAAMTACTLVSVELSPLRALIVLVLDPAPVKWPIWGDEALLAMRWEGPEDGTGEIMLPANRLRRLEGGQFSATLRLPRLRGPLRALEFRALPRLGALHFRKGVEERLRKLFPATDEEYVTAMQSHHARWGNLRTRYFLAEQVVRFFTGSPEHRIGATLIMAYKAVELDDPACYGPVLAAIEAGLAVARGLPVDWHPRRNGQHLEISLLTALWHVHLARGEVEAAHGALTQLREASGKLVNHATAAYSASKGLLMLGWLEWRQGRLDEAKACWMETVEMFRLAARDADPYKAVLFRELSHSLEAAYQAGLCLRALAPRPANEMPSLADLLPHASRVPEKVRQRMAETIKAYFDAKSGMERANDLQEEISRPA